MEKFKKISLSQLKKAIIISSNQFSGQEETALPTTRGRNMKNYCLNLSFDTCLLENKGQSEISSKIKDVVEELSEEALSNHSKLLLVYYAGVSSRQEAFSYVQYGSEEQHLDFSELIGVAEMDKVEVIIVLDLLMCEGEQLKFEYEARGPVHRLVIKNPRCLFESADVASTGKNLLQKLLGFEEYGHVCKLIMTPGKDTDDMKDILQSFGFKEAVFDTFKHIVNFKVKQEINACEKEKKKLLELRFIDTPFNQNTFCKFAESYKLGEEFDNYKVFHYENNFIFFYSKTNIRMYRTNPESGEKEIFQVYEDALAKRNDKAYLHSPVFMPSKKIILIVQLAHLQYIYCENFETQRTPILKMRNMRQISQYDNEQDEKECSIHKLNTDHFMTRWKMQIRIFRIDDYKVGTHIYTFIETNAMTLSSQVNTKDMLLHSCVSDGLGQVYFMLQKRDEECTYGSFIYLYCHSLQKFQVWFNGEFNNGKKARIEELFVLRNNEVMGRQEGHHCLANLSTTQQRHLTHKFEGKVDQVGSKSDLICYQANNRIYLHWAWPDRSYLLFNMPYLTEMIDGGPLFIDRYNFFLQVRIQNEGLFWYHMKIDEDFVQQHIP